jgi:hypothetical protein
MPKRVAVRTLAVILPLSLSLMLSAGQVFAHGEHLKPQFGGITAEAEVFQIEMVTKGNQITLYLSEHGAPVESAAASGKLLVLTGKVKEEVALTPNGFQSLGAKLKTNPAQNAKAVATITVPGRGTGTARFTFK